MFARFQQVRQTAARAKPGRPLCGAARVGALGSLGMAEPINVWDYERLAAEKLDENALAYFAGGAAVAP